MPVNLEKSADDMFVKLPIHFDLPAHALPLETFIRTSQYTNKLIEAFNQEVFGGELEYEIRVFPPQDGSFLAIFGVAVVAVGVAWQFLESDIGRAFIRGLTNHEPSYWSEKAGIAIRKKLERDRDITDLIEPTATPPPDEVKSVSASVMLIEATINFLQTDASTLQSAGIRISRFREGYSARNEFYKACSAVPEIRAIGFDDAPIFPIKRSDFARLAVTIPPEKSSDDEPWNLSFAVLRVTSPNWKQNDMNRLWVGEDGNGKERHFKIDDLHFWDLVATNQLKVSIVDTIKVQWAYQGTERKPKKIRVLRVLDFNGAKLSDPLDGNALDAILGTYAVSESQRSRTGHKPDQGDQLQMDI